jgi:dCMP deaminase
MRPDWDEINLNIAKEYSRRGTCPRMQVGALFVTPDNRPLSVGYNGAPAGQPHCTEGGCALYWYGEGVKRVSVDREYSHGQGSYTTLVDEPDKLIKRCKRAIHAEMNAIGYAARNGISLAGSTLYLWPVGPCHNCELVLATVGIAELVFPSKEYIYDVSAPILKKMGVKIRNLDV